MSEPLEVVGARIARLALAEVPGGARVGAGPVVTVVRDTMSGKLYIGFNKDLSKESPELADALYKAILEQKGRIWKGEVIVVRTDPSAVGGHSEVDALNPAIRDREKVLGRKLMEKDLRVFELHNVWLRGDRAGKTAPRCEHCARITRGVSVTQSVFVAEGGVVGEIKVPQRGPVIPAGGRLKRPVTTTSGVTRPGGASKRVTTTSGSMGGGAIGTMLGGLLTAGAVLALPALTRWFNETFVAERANAEMTGLIMKAIEKSVPKFNTLTITQMVNIYKEKAAGRQVKLRVDVDVEWIDSSAGPVPFGSDAAKVAYYNLVFEGDTEAEWPLFQDHYGFWKNLMGAARITRRRHTYYLPL